MTIPCCGSDPFRLQIPGWPALAQLGWFCEHAMLRHSHTTAADCLPPWAMQLRRDPGGTLEIRSLRRSRVLLWLGGYRGHTRGHNQGSRRKPPGRHVVLEALEAVLMCRGSWLGGWVGAPSLGYLGLYKTKPGHFKL